MLRYQERGLGKKNQDSAFSRMDEFKPDTSYLSQVLSKNKPQTDVPSFSQLTKYEPPVQHSIGNNHTPLGGSYFDKMSNVESGGSYTAENPNSGAYGRYQFLKSTAVPMLRKYGATWEDFKRSPQLQDKLASDFTAQNASILRKNGFAPTDRNLYMAHNLGIGSALKALRGKAVGSKFLEANNVSSIDEWNRKPGYRF